MNKMILVIDFTDQYHAIIHEGDTESLSSVHVESEMSPSRKYHRKKNHEVLPIDQGQNEIPFFLTVPENADKHYIFDSSGDKHDLDCIESELQMMIEKQGW